MKTTRPVIATENQDALVILGVAAMCALAMSFAAGCGPRTANAQIRPRIDEAARSAPTPAGAGVRRIAERCNGFAEKGA